jgi:hypothetical protein
LEWEDFFIKKLKTVDFRREIQVNVSNRDPPIHSDSLLYRVIGLSGVGTYLFDLKNDKKAESKLICRIHPDFIVSFVGNLVRQ